MQGCSGRPLVASRPLPSRAALPRLVPLPCRLLLQTQAIASQGAEGRLQGAVQYCLKQRHYDGSAAAAASDVPAAAYDEHVITWPRSASKKSQLARRVTSDLQINEGIKKILYNLIK